MNSDQIITALNEMSSSEEGKAEVAKLMSAFKQDQKISSASEVLKAQSGAALRSAQRQEYRNAMNEYRNDAEMNKYRRGYLRDMARERANNVSVPQSNSAQTSPIFDRTKAQEIMSRRNIGNRNYGDNRVLVKKAKAAATEGFDESMYNFDPNQTFDRDRFRDRKQVARIMNPEWNWRQRRAFALQDSKPEPKIDVMPENQGSFALPKLNISSNSPVWIDTSSVTNRQVMQNPDKINTNIDFSQFEEDLNISPMIAGPKNIAQQRSVETQMQGKYPLRPEYQPVPSQHETMVAHAQQGTLGGYFSSIGNGYIPAQQQKPASSPYLTEEQFRNHSNFRDPYLGSKTVKIDGVEYPVAVTTGLIGKGAPMFGGVNLENDATYAYDASTGKIRKVKENMFGVVEGTPQFVEGSE